MGIDTDSGTRKQPKRRARKNRNAVPGSTDLSSDTEHNEVATKI